MEGGSKVGQHMVLLAVSATLLIDARLWSFACHAYLVEQDVIDLAIPFFVTICLPLQYVNKSRTICGSRFVQCEHFFDELAIHETVHVEHILHDWEVFESAPVFWFIVCINSSCTFLASFSIIFRDVSLLYSSLLKLPKHSLILSPVKDFEKSVAKPVLVCLAKLVQVEFKFLHDEAVSCIGCWHLNVDHLGAVLALGDLLLFL